MFIPHTSEKSTRYEHESFQNFWITPTVGLCAMSQHPPEVLRSDSPFKFECKSF